MAEQPVNIEAIEQLAMIDQRPIPGQSLTNNSENPLPFEGPPQTVRVTEALHGVFEELIEEKNYMGIMDAINDEIPISDIVQIILFDGFSKGMWNPDLMLILIEPLMYLVMALADKAGIDYVLYPDEEDDEAVGGVISLEGDSSSKPPGMMCLRNMMLDPDHLGSLGSV